MDDELPGWLNKDFIKEALQRSKTSETILVNSIQVDKPVPKGENYLCNIFRVNTSYTKSGTPTKTSLIVKSPMSGGVIELFKQMGAFQKESKTYYEYIPRMDKLLSGKKITPEAYYSTEQDVVVMEDLKFKGFSIADRRKQLDYEHCVAVLKTLAVLHATSVKLHETDPEFVEDIGKETLYADKHKHINYDYLKLFFIFMAKKCEETPELARYADRFNDYAETFWDVLVGLLKPKENSFNVLNHGDPWVTNILFRYEDGKPVESKLIDLQLSRYTSPSIDLLYFFYSSVQEDVRQKRQDELLRVYLTELNSTLEQLGLSQRLKESELKDMMESNEFFAIFMTVWLYPFVIADPKYGVLDLEEFSQESLADINNSPLKANFNGKKFLEVIPKRLQEFEKNATHTMDNEIPKWLNKNFIQDALQRTETSETILVDSIEVDKPIPKGENYLCEIFRVNTSYKKSGKPTKTSLIVKSPMSGGVVDNFAEMGAFKKEFSTYYEYIPKMDTLLSGKKITAESYYSSKQDIVVLEDLKFNGYSIADRRKQLDYDHCVVVLKSLAKFHAASVKIHETDPEFVENLGKDALLGDNRKDLNFGYFKPCFILLAEKCKETPELVRYADRLIDYAETFWDILMELVKPRDNGFNVLNHGDPWVTNILFRYEDGKPVDSRLIDLQLVRYTWPSIDLLYFFYSSVQDETREKRRDELLRVYLTELNSTLENIGSSQRLKESELNDMMESSEFFGLFITIWLYPFVVMDPKDGVINLEDLSPESMSDINNSPLKLNFNGKTFLNVIPKRLQEFAKNGWF